VIVARVTKRFRSGQPIALREIWANRIWYARPALIVQDSPGGTMLHVPSGVRCREAVDADGLPLRLYQNEWQLAETRWERSWSLSFAFPGLAYGVILQFEPGSDRFLGFYVNLQSPLARTEVGFDYVEHVLDVRIEADRSSWSWKDEDELAEAVERGLFTPQDERWFHHWGERAVERVLLREVPFDRDWSTWRPDPSWGVPVLPQGWETVPVGTGAGSP
jgi:predicted RNA-binding protein associated with RNAse of E/G family